MKWHEVRLADCAPQPWRNGGGLTHELLAWPPVAATGTAGASGSEPGWLVRLSVARIDRDGPFSAFPGVDRAFAVLEGPGVVLGFGAAGGTGGERHLAPGSEPLLFAGEDAPGCHLAGAPTLDLNLMGRREAGRIAMRRAAAGHALAGAHAWRGVYAHAPARLDTPAGPLALAARTLCWSDDASTLAGAWTLLDGPQAFLLAWTPKEPRT